jgi:hypothetical protein
MLAVRVFDIGWLHQTPEGVGWLAVLFYSLHFIVGRFIPHIMIRREVCGWEDEPADNKAQ